MFGDYRFAKAHQDRLLREAKQARLPRVARELRQTRTALATAALILTGICIVALVAAGI